MAVEVVHGEEAGVCLDALLVDEALAELVDPDHRGGQRAEHERVLELVRVEADGAAAAVHMPQAGAYRHGHPYAVARVAGMAERIDRVALHVVLEHFLVVLVAARGEDDGLAGLDVDVRTVLRRGDAPDDLAGGVGEQPLGGRGAHDLDPALVYCVLVDGEQVGARVARAGRLVGGIAHDAVLLLGIGALDLLEAGPSIHGHLGAGLEAAQPVDTLDRLVGEDAHERLVTVGMGDVEQAHDVLVGVLGVRGAQHAAA